MPTGTALDNPKKQGGPHKVADRNGMHVVVAISGTVIFRCDYRLNVCRETLTIRRKRGRRVDLSVHRLLLITVRETPGTAFETGAELSDYWSTPTRNQRSLPAWSWQTGNRCASAAVGARTPGTP